MLTTHIPTVLRYEELDGRVLYRKGYHDVIWVTTEGTRKILIAQPGQDWRVTDWESI